MELDVNSSTLPVDGEGSVEKVTLEAVEEARLRTVHLQVLLLL
jgi:hypothetical protein